MDEHLHILVDNKIDETIRLDLLNSFYETSIEYLNNWENYELQMEKFKLLEAAIKDNNYKLFIIMLICTLNVVSIIIFIILHNRLK